MTSEQELRNQAYDIIGKWIDEAIKGEWSVHRLRIFDLADSILSLNRAPDLTLSQNSFDFNQYRAAIIDKLESPEMEARLQITLKHAQMLGEGVQYQAKAALSEIRKAMGGDDA